MPQHHMLKVWRSVATNLFSRYRCRIHAVRWLLWYRNVIWTDAVVRQQMVTCVHINGSCAGRRRLSAYDFRLITVINQQLQVIAEQWHVTASLRHNIKCLAMSQPHFKHSYTQPAADFGPSRLSLFSNQVWGLPSSCRVPLPFEWYQNILLGDRGPWHTWPAQLLQDNGSAQIKPVVVQSPQWYPSHYTIIPRMPQLSNWNSVDYKDKDSYQHYFSDPVTLTFELMTQPFSRLCSMFTSGFCLLL